jgi:hypothetical protein
VGVINLRCVKGDSVLINSQGLSLQEVILCTLLCALLVHFVITISNSINTILLYREIYSYLCQSYISKKCNNNSLKTEDGSQRLKHRVGIWNEARQGAVQYLKSVR